MKIGLIVSGYKMETKLVIPGIFHIKEFPPLVFHLFISSLSYELKAMS